MLVLGEASPHDQPSSSLVNLVPRDTRLENRKGRVICLSCSLEHARHSFRHDSGSDEIVPLNIATVAVVLDAKVQLDKISPPDPSTIVADVAHWIVAYQHGGTAINGPGRAELLFLEELVRKLVDLLVLLPRLDHVLKRVIDLLTFSNRFLDQLNLSRDQSSPQGNSQVLARDQPFRRILQSGAQIRLHAGCQAISRTLIMAPVHGNLPRPPHLANISQLGRRTLATRPAHLIVQFLRPNRPTPH